MAVTINVNGLSLVHKGSEGIAQSTMPDVCLTPSGGGPVPLPYTNVARSANLANGSLTVWVDGGHSAAIRGSEFAVSEGDEAGSVGGVTSGTHLKEAKWLTYSPDVKIEGRNACRLTDHMTLNHGNTVCMAGEQQGAVEEEEIDCAAEWEKLDSKADEIGSIEDPIERNKQISAAYAQMYGRNHDLQWSGAAAFASKQVGCALDAAQDRMDGPFGGSARTLHDGLAEGNQAVFEEIYPVMEFYDEHGLEALEQCAATRDPPVPEELLSGLEEVSDGNLADGALRMLFHEQNKTLQEVVYDNPAFERAIRLNQLGEKLWVGRLFGTQPIKANYSADCDAAEELVFDGWNFANFEERWPFVKQVVEGFGERVVSDPVGVNEGLDIIAGWGR